MVKLKLVILKFYKVLSFDNLDGHLTGPFWAQNGENQTKEGCHTSSVGLKGRSSTWMSHVHERRDAFRVWVMYC